MTAAECMKEVGLMTSAMAMATSCMPTAITTQAGSVTERLMAKECITGQTESFTTASGRSVKKTGSGSGNQSKKKPTSEIGQKEKPTAKVSIRGNNGDKYDGEWMTCLKHGKGQDLYANGDSYTGQYRYGKPWGIGVYRWKNGSVYQGQFKNGLKHGKGKWSKGSGEDMCTFEGNYVNGKKEGYGEFKWASGNFYRGEYLNDERHGYGEMYWVDGS